MAERIAFVTGASSGFGLGVALELHRRGWLVHAAVRNLARAPAELKELRLVQCDLGNAAQISAAAQGIDRLDCLINNAGYGLVGPFATYSGAQMLQQFNVNVVGPALLIQAFLPALEQAKGLVINVSSVLGEAGTPMNSVYCASKYALEGLSESLFHEMKSRGVRVALVEPGGFRTKFGHNLAWGEKAANANSVEARQLAAFRAMRERMLAGSGRDPAAVVAKIVRVAEMSDPPLRTRVGMDVHLMRLARRLLPESILLAMVGRVFRRRMLGEEAK
jgi:NAD(P)-dependent dehydrogenase (short-subunit alcohol dehydrogenase family)